MAIELMTTIEWRELKVSQAAAEARIPSSRNGDLPDGEDERQKLEAKASCGSCEDLLLKLDPPVVGIMFPSTASGPW